MDDSVAFQLEVFLILCQIVIKAIFSDIFRDIWLYAVECSHVHRISEI